MTTLSQDSVELVNEPSTCHDRQGEMDEVFLGVFPNSVKIEICL